jgi:O-antigen/teichoic acid export membrane protein
MALIQKGFGQIKALIMILMIGQLFDMVSGLNSELIGVTKHYRFNFWIALLLLVFVVVLDFILIKEIGIYGAAWGTTIGLVFFNITKAIFLWKKMDMQPFQKASLYILGAGLLSGLLAWALPYLGNVYLDVICRSMLFCLLLWFTLYKAKVSSELNDITDNLLHRRRFY